MDKAIILENGKPPQFIGSWTIGEAMQMLQAALAWLGQLPLVMSDGGQLRANQLSKQTADGGQRSTVSGLKEEHDQSG